MTMTRVVPCVVFAVLSLFLGPSVVLALTDETSAEQAMIDDFLEAGSKALQGGHYERARKDFSRAVDLSGGASTTAHMGLAATNFRLERFETAIHLAEKVLTMTSLPHERAFAYNILGTALWEVSSRTQKSARDEIVARAEVALRQAVYLSGGDLSVAWSNLALVLEAQDRFTESVDALREYVNQVPQDRAARARLCRAKFLAHSTSESTTLNETPEGGTSVAVQQDPTSPKAALDKPESPDEGAPSEKGSPVRLGGEVQPPVKLSARPPRYPEAARRARIQGPVTLEAIIDREGNVTNVKVLEGLPVGLSEAAADAVKEWRFKPATLNGQPVAVIYQVTINFGLDPGRIERVPVDVQVEESFGSLAEGHEQTPLKVGGEVLPPKRIHFPQPLYTEDARLARVQGVVILEAVIDEFGAVTDVKVIKGLPKGLSRSAALTACQWQFEPATRDGDPVPVYFNLTTRFSLDHKKEE